MFSPLFHLVDLFTYDELDDLFHDQIDYLSTLDPPEIFLYFHTIDYITLAKSVRRDRDIK